MVRGVRIALLVATLTVLPRAARAAKPCDDLIPARGGTMPPRALVPEDLARLRDIGPVDPAQASSGLFTVSPDGSRAAFQLRRGDPGSNSFCLAMLVVDLRGGPASVVDRGGAFIRFAFDFRGRAQTPTGLAKPITPRWLPDGKSIAFLRRDAGGAVQIWQANADGSGSRALTHSFDDIEDFRILPKGAAIVFSTRPALRAGLSAIEAEGRSGFHYDDRFAPSASSRPFVAPVAPATMVLGIADGTVRPATGEEAALLGARDIHEGSWTESVSPGGDRAWIEVPPQALFASLGTLHARIGARMLACTAPSCTGASRPWWTRAGRVRFLRSEGWASSETAIYEWQPGRGAPERLYATEDYLVDCTPSGDRLACLREGSLVPRRLEMLDPASGKREILFDPNPDFRTLALGRPARRKQRNSFGLESIADLVLPVGYKPGTRYPLVVVQYNTRGFLRGGTGDDYPIQAFANRGFAILSVSRPKAVALLHIADIKPSELEQGDRINLRDFADRRSTLESVEIAVRDAIDRGIADPARIGITGLSDGASTAGFALLNSKLFSAFAISSCCYDTVLPMRVGPAAARHFASTGYPLLSDNSPAAKAFWEALGISPNAARIHAPILVQTSDDEYLGALQSYTALRELGRPIELYVFPDEHHVKWQPAHRLAVYTRAIDWFDFWLNGVIPPGREREAEAWGTLREGLAKAP